MKISVNKDYDKMSRAAADLVIEQVKSKPDSLICFPSGDSPAGMFKCLIDDVKAGRIDLSQCYFVGLDEWVGLGKDDDGSCTKFLYEHFFTPLQADMTRVKFFNAKATDLDTACRDMDDFIKQHGPLEMMIVGIGMNGHIGLNEPGADFNLYCHHAPLAQLTVEVGQKYFKQKTTLTEGITLGLKYLQEAKMAVLLAAGAKKAGVVKQALEGVISQHVPASLFQTLPAAVVLLDEDAASALTI